VKDSSVRWMAECAAKPFHESLPQLLANGFDPQDSPLSLREVKALFYDDTFRRSVSPLRKSYRRVSVVRDQKLVDHSEYESLAGARCVRRQDVTIKLHAAHLYADRVRQVGQRLANATRLPLHATVYLSSTGRQGVPLHSDADSVFALQVTGQKTWLFYRPRATSPQDTDNVGWILEDGQTEQMAPRCDAVCEITVTPGDILYVPRGWGHYALAEDGESLHVSLGVLHPEVDQTKVALQEPLMPNVA